MLIGVTPNLRINQNKHLFIAAKAFGFCGKHEKIANTVKNKNHINKKRNGMTLNF